MIEKLVGILSFTGGVIIVFMGVGVLVIRGVTGEIPEIAEYILMLLIVVFGCSTAAHVITSGLGKGKPGSKGPSDE
ncbi:hypothetical protein [Reichenbachiella ulvae]|uniref:Uncharacterized protein n=1 Tax=Reichenbachiella ulvae TaxID=2980104 RepID=A0ABT3CVT5_9BACT|nr:hypothetical protein [Reichenbachiella ulvae]MCV9387821.1 hypothetical protein [Reichenbachiella ulvae]